MKVVARLVLGKEGGTLWKDITKHIDSLET
jgi:hypothetical protein